MIEQKYLSSEIWLDGVWCDDWVRALPESYWQAMVPAILRDFVPWVPQEKWEEYLRSESGRGQMCAQLFVRLSQASANFIPWLSEVVELFGARVLEIGCGTGCSTAALSRAGALVTGYDVTEEFLNINRVRLAELNFDARLQLVPADWLMSLETAEKILQPVQGEPPFDIIVCYALLEHLLPNERLVLLSAIRAMLAANPNAYFVVFETPNRLAPNDWHSTQTHFPDILPDEIAQAYLAKRLALDHPWRGNLSAFRTEAGRNDWYRGGRGVSFHEFDVAFGIENLAVIQDGYSDRCGYMRHLHRSASYEASLAELFAEFDPPVPRGFCCPTLDLVLRWRGPSASERKDAWARDAGGGSRELFSHYYVSGMWGSHESKSGRGSELDTTEVLRGELQAWISLHPNVETVLDAPCGDYNWMQAFNWPKSVHYIGADVVPELIEELIARYTEPRRNFRELDIINNAIPEVDLWLCRDALIHFPFSLGQLVTRKFQASSIRYFLATTFPHERNGVDCELGGYHKVNLARPPFNLGPPETLLRDPAENRQTDRFIGVWRNPKFGPAPGDNIT